ncbi:MAG: hypothetical protein F6K47_05700 [Symploca sp. SIO2E6]|nr:hypothetical protein [Symploca sp. SIO2E6]
MSKAPVIGHWLFVICYWSLVIRHLQKLKIDLPPIRVSGSFLEMSIRIGRANNKGQTTNNKQQTTNNNSLFCSLE